MDDILRAASLVGLRNQAAAPVELFGKGVRQFGKRADRQMADKIRSQTPAYNDLAGFGELSRRLLRRMQRALPHGRKGSQHQGRKDKQDEPRSHHG